MRISIDFDGTLEFQSIQDYAKELIERGVEVWIVTSRFGDNEKFKKFFNTSKNVDLSNRDLHEVANKLGIPEERRHFTNMKDKWEFLENRGFIWHLDDDWIENEMINERTSTKGIDVFPQWKEKCETLLERAN